MKGNVQIANNGKGVYWITGDDGNTYFFNEKDIAGQLVGMRCILPRWPVEFDGRKEGRRFRASNVLALAQTGLVRNEVDPFGFEETAAEIPLHIDNLGRITVGENILLPALEARNAWGALRAYYLGTHNFRGFELRVPQSLPEAGFVLLNRDKKVPDPDEVNDGPDAELGSYLVKAQANGQVDIWGLCVRVQSGTHRWVVIERRYRHQYDLSNYGRDSILAQTPTSNMEARDNDGFVDGIIVAFDAQLAAAA